MHKFTLYNFFASAFVALMLFSGCTTYIKEKELDVRPQKKAIIESLEAREAPEENDPFIYRVQVAAEETDSVAFEKAALVADSSGFEPVHIRFENDFWKVQVGDFDTRPEADAARRELLGAGWVGSWVVKIDPPPIFGTPIVEEPDTTATQPGFRIQVAAYSDKISAEAAVKTLRDGIDEPVYMIEEDGLFKVQVGDFKESKDAEELIETLTESGYEDLWVVEAIINVTLEPLESE